MRTRAPSALLAPFVRELMLVEVADETTRVRLPEPGLVLGVRYRGSAAVLGGGAAARLPDVSLAGMSSTARRMRTAPGSGVALALFHPGGAAPFLPGPLHQLYGATVPLDDLLPRSEVERLRSRVAEARCDAERFAALETFLVARLRPQHADPVVAAAVRVLRETRGTVRIGALARELAISLDPLEKRFRRVVGASPKQLASILRLRHAVDAYRPGQGLGELALAAGYFDQSHFHRELRAVTGEAPRRFLRAGEYR